MDKMELDGPRGSLDACPWFMGVRGSRARGSKVSGAERSTRTRARTTYGNSGSRPQGQAGKNKRSCVERTFNVVGCVMLSGTLLLTLPLRPLHGSSKFVHSTEYNVPVPACPELRRKLPARTQLFT